MQHMRHDLPPSFGPEQTPEEAPAEAHRPSVRLLSVSLSFRVQHFHWASKITFSLLSFFGLQLWQEVLWGQRSSAAHEQAHGPEALPVSGVWEVLQLEEGLVLTRQVAQRSRALQVSVRTRQWRSSSRFRQNVEAGVAVLDFQQPPGAPYFIP